jgi:50S ribosomal protein L16 3-hydroxylase
MGLLRPMPETRPMRMPESLSAEQFLQDHWQKRALFMPGGLGEVAPALTANELAWLATLPDVESRLVFTERGRDKISYRLETGPFEEAKLEALPDKDWTLLVQDVEKHLPDFRDYFQQVSFIPDWRIDDLMVSFAAPGGSVGPHVDNYDVFLCQGHGEREWLLGDPASAIHDDSAEALSLLQPFSPMESHLVATGDVLYLPPGLPHWGVATDFCMTYSIGMRSPTKSELGMGACRVLETDDFVDEAGNAEQKFYRDGDLGVVEAIPGKIHGESIRRVREQGLLDIALDDERAARVLGSVVTDPKAWLMPDPVTGKVANEVSQSPQGLSVHGMARIAWYEAGDVRLIFVNGLARNVPVCCLDFVQQVCAGRCAPAPSVARLITTVEGRKLLSWMLEQGLFDAEFRFE